MALGAWLQFCRWHTAALTSSVLVLGHLLAGEPLLGWGTLLWALFGLCFHSAGFQNNNIMDYWHDLDDPHKSHMVLVSGAIPLRHAIQVNAALIALTAFLGAYLTRLSPLPLLVLIACALSGFAYNLVSKATVLGPVPISLCFGLLAAVSYFSAGGEPCTLIGLVLAYLLAAIWFQIAWEGFKKDIEADRVNLLRRLGAKVEGDRFVATRGAVLFGWASKLPTIALGIPIFAASGSSWVAAVPLALAIAGQGYASAKLIFPGRWVHRETVRYCAVTEILTLWTLLFALQGAIGWAAVAALIAIPLAWFVFWNRVYWKSYIAPRV